MRGLVIRNGKIVDGSGAPAQFGDIAIDGRIISTVGGKAGPGVEDIPEETLAAEINWQRESFGEYLDAPWRTRRAIDR